MIVAGRGHVVGYDPMEVARQIQAAADRPRLARIDVRRTGDTLAIALAPVKGAELPGSMLVQLVAVRPHQMVRIRRGENAGKTLDYANIVTLWKVVGRWDGRAPLSLTAAAPDGDTRSAVVVQAEGPGAIVAAARAD